MKIFEINDLRKSFNKTEVLKGVSFSLEEGQVLAVIGSSGSGKTTLLRCINFLETADKGQITVEGKCIYDGESAQKLSAAQIRENQLNFTEIAAALQYSTVHHYSRQFKEKFGITPSEYAKTVR